MQIGLYANTHGVGWRDATTNYTRSVPAHTLRPVDVARAAEAAGFHSMWFPDHVCMPLETGSAHIANETGTRSYSPRHEMLDAAVVMGAVAGATSNLKLGTSVLIAPYRGPLNDVRQFTTVDVLSGGRLVLGVGAGWMREEFDALGVPFGERGRRTEECIEIYKRAWTDEVVNFSGEFYEIGNVSMDPKPTQHPRPPIIYGGVAPRGARRAARHCDGLYPVFLDPQSDPTRLANLHEIVRSELDEIGRDPATFTMMAATTLRLTAADDPLTDERPRRICTGTVEQVVSDLERFAAAGYSLVVCKMDCPSGDVEELIEQIRWVGADVIPQAAEITSAGGWQPTL